MKPSCRRRAEAFAFVNINRKLFLRLYLKLLSSIYNQWRGVVITCLACDKLSTCIISKCVIVILLICYLYIRNSVRYIVCSPSTYKYVAWRRWWGLSLSWNQNKGNASLHSDSSMVRPAAAMANWWRCRACSMMRKHSYNQSLKLALTTPGNDIM